jgi:cbb3-type cytochrome oxidase subunit 1
MFNKQNSASLNFMLTASTWLVVGTLMGLILALEFVFPDLFHGVPWLVFSRLRQAHTNTVMFAFLSGGMMGMWLYIVPRLTGRRLWSERLGNLTMLLWNVAVAAGIIGLLAAMRPEPRVRRVHLAGRRGRHGRPGPQPGEPLHDHRPPRRTQDVRLVVVHQW